MKVAAIKKLVENHDIHALMDAETALVEEQPLPFDVDGDDEGEKLTHILAAVFVRNEMEDNGTDFRTALRKYSERVRNSIS